MANLLVQSIPYEVREQQYKRWIKKSEPFLKRFIRENIEVTHSLQSTFDVFSILPDNTIVTRIKFKNLPNCSMTMPVDTQLISQLNKNNNKKSPSTNDILSQITLKNIDNKWYTSTYCTPKSGFFHF